jgi:hypothetical protein
VFGAASTLFCSAVLRQSFFALVRRRSGDILFAVASSLYSVEVVRSSQVRELPPTRLIDDNILALAQRSKWPKYAAFTKTPRALFEAIVSALRAQPAAQAARTLAPNAKLLPMRRALKGLALHQAGHGEPPDGGFLELLVTAIHPDAGMPLGTNPFGKLDTFIVRLLASGSTANPYSEYGYSSKPLRVRGEDLWDFSLSRATKAKAPAYLTATLEIVAPTAHVAHLQVGQVFESTAYIDPPKKA